MPPQYKTYEPAPLSPYTMGLLQEVSSTNPGDFNAKYNDALKTKQAIEAQQLNQQAVQMSLAEKQRQAAMDKAQAEAIAAEYAANPSAFTPEQAMKTTQGVAFKYGDIDRILAIEKATRERAGGDYLLTGQAAIDAGVPEGTPLSVARLNEQRKYREDITARHNESAKKKKRFYDAILAEQNATGTKRTQLPAAFRSQIIGARGAKVSIDKVKTLIPEMDTGVLNALKSGQLTGMYKEPGSASYRLFAQLEKLKKEVARMNDTGALSGSDVSMFNELVAGSPVYNSPESLALAMSDLEDYVAAKEQVIIDTNESSGVNMDAFRTGQAPAAVPRYEDPDALAQSLAGQEDPSNSGWTPDEEAEKQAIVQRRMDELRAKAGQRP